MIVELDSEGRTIPFVPPIPKVDPRVAREEREGAFREKYGTRLATPVIASINRTPSSIVCYEGKAIKVEQLFPLIASSLISHLNDFPEDRRSQLLAEYLTDVHRLEFSY
jgi:hypothetical protein